MGEISNGTSCVGIDWVFVLRMMRSGGGQIRHVESVRVASCFSGGLV
jgi:hypothetical protein